MVNHAINWFKSYLGNRSYSAENSDDLCSDWNEMMITVLQNSILGPKMFDVFICDLSAVLRYWKYHAYADDSKTYISGPLSSLIELLEIVQQYIINAYN